MSVQWVLLGSVSCLLGQFGHTKSIKSRVQGDVKQETEINWVELIKRIKRVAHLRVIGARISSQVYGRARETCGSLWCQHVIHACANHCKPVQMASQKILSATSAGIDSKVGLFNLIMAHLSACLNLYQTYISNCHKLCKAQINVRIRGSESHEFAFRINKIGPEYSDIYHLTKLAHLIAKIVISADRKSVV